MHRSDMQFFYSNMTKLSAFPPLSLSLSPTKPKKKKEKTLSFWYRYKGFIEYLISSLSYDFICFPEVCNWVKLYRHWHISLFVWWIFLCSVSGDALFALKNSLKASPAQLADWNQNQVNPCTWSNVQCDSNNNVTRV